MSARDWPEQQAFLAKLDDLKDRHAIRHDSALAELAGISHTSVSNWRNGKSRPSVTAIHRLAAAIKEPAQPLLVTAGLIEDEGDTVDLFADMPHELRRLITVYREADAATRSRLKGQIGFLVEWAESAVEPEAKGKRSS